MSPNAGIRIAHLSDVHLSLTGRFPWRMLNAKRTLGWLNWQRNRRFIHTRSAIDAIIADLKQQAPDHILISGDLINIGLPDEYQAASAWLQSVGAPDYVSLVPGNHDTYVTAQAIPGLALWAPYMADDAFGRSLGISRVSMLGQRFPYVRRVGCVIIIGVNSGIATPPGSAVGAVGAAQRVALGQILKATAALGLARVVMIHHPPVPGLATGHRAMIDCADFADTLSQAGADLVVHGHNHTMTQVMFAGATIQGIASASATFENECEPLARYNMMTFTFEAGTLQIGIETRGLDASGGNICRLSRVDLPIRHRHDEATPS